MNILPYFFLEEIMPTEGNIYKYKSELTFLTGNETIVIDDMQIKSIAIDSNYKELNMPMIFVTASIDRNHMDSIIDSQNTGTAIFKIQKCVDNSEMPDIFIDYISDRFTYFVAMDINKAADMDYEGNNEGREDLYKLTTFGLMSLDCVNKNKKNISGVYEGTMQSIVYYLTNHLDILIEPFASNPTINEFFPPMNSITKALKYLDSLNVFYNTPYRWFIDFDCAYILSSSGKPVYKKGEDIGTIFLEIHKFTDMTSKVQGMTTEGSRYHVHIDSIDCTLSDSRISEKSFSNVTGLSTFGSSYKDSIQTKSVIIPKNRTIRVDNENSGLLTNLATDVKNSSVQMLVQKTDLDGSSFTLNKEYIVKCDEVYGKTDYNGNYLLSRKRELYVRVDEKFVMNTMLLLEKIS